MKNKWNSLTKVSKKKLLSTLGRSDEEIKNKVFQLIVNSNIKLDFRWCKFDYFDEKLWRQVYKIKCTSAKEDYIFSQIKKELGKKIQWQTIDKYLRPVAQKIWALKMAQDVSRPQSNPENIPFGWRATLIEVAEAECEKEVDPDYPKPLEWWRDPVDPNTISVPNCLDDGGGDLKLDNFDNGDGDPNMNNLYSRIAEEDLPKGRWDLNY